MNPSQHTIHPIESISLSQSEAFAGILIASAASDGNISKKEQECIRFTLSQIRLFKGWSNDQYSSMFTKLIAVLKARKIEQFIKMSADALSPEFYETAFVISTDIMLADGVLEKKEQSFILHLKQHLKIKDELAAKIGEVMIIKNKANDVFKDIKDIEGT